MIRALRRWLTFLREIRGEPEPRVLRNSVDRVRRLQRRVAQQANRNPLNTPERPVRQLDRGFQ